MNIEEVKGFFILNGFDVETINSSIDIYVDKKSYYFNNPKNNVSFWLYEVCSQGTIYSYDFHPGSFYSQTVIKNLKSFDHSPFSILRSGRRLNNNSQKIMVTVSAVTPNFELKNNKIIGHTFEGKRFPLFMNEDEFLDYFYNEAN